MKPDNENRETPNKVNRRGDPFFDRRSGEDQRIVYSLEYFKKGNECRRSGIERRTNYERRAGYVRVSEWSSVCPISEDRENNDGDFELQFKKQF